MQIVEIYCVNVGPFFICTKKGRFGFLCVKLFIWRKFLIILMMDNYDILDNIMNLPRIY